MVSLRRPSCLSRRLLRHGVCGVGDIDLLDHNTLDALFPGVRHLSGSVATFRLVVFGRTAGLREINREESFLGTFLLQSRNLLVDLVRNLGPRLFVASRLRSHTRVLGHLVSRIPAHIAAALCVYLTIIRIPFVGSSSLLRAAGVFSGLHSGKLGKVRSQLCVFTSQFLVFALEVLRLEVRNAQLRHSCVSFLGQLLQCRLGKLRLSIDDIQSVLQSEICSFQF